MHNFIKHTIYIATICLFAASCKKNDGSNPSNKSLVLTYKFDSMQARLNNIGQPATVGLGKAGQSPVFNSMSAHYIELSKDIYTPLGSGAVLYKAPEVSTGGAAAIDFSKATPKGDGQVFFNTKLLNIPNGTYEYIRISLAYQNYDIKVKQGTNIVIGTLASFIGYNSYITTHTIRAQQQVVNANKPQGYWAFEANGIVLSGQAPAGATTVPNPLFASSPIPQGSCVVTAAFVDATGNPKPLVIKGGETADAKVLVSLSTNKSFEWNDTNANGFFEPALGESVIDMGIRGMKPILSW
jgi:hypothetical protein